MVCLTAFAALYYHSFFLFHTLAHKAELQRLRGSHGDAQDLPCSMDLVSHEVDSMWSLPRMVLPLRATASVVKVEWIGSEGHRAVWSGPPTGRFAKVF